MKHGHTTVLLAAMLMAMPVATRLHAAPPHAGKPSSEQGMELAQWAVWGGEIEFIWNRDLMQDLGLRVGSALHRLPELGEPHVERLALREAAGLEMKVRDSADFVGFAGGRLQVRGGFEIGGKHGAFDLRDFQLRPRPGQPFELELVGNDGIAWFYIDKLMYKLDGGRDPQLVVRAMDLRISPALAQRIGVPGVADWVVAGLQMRSRVSTPGAVVAEAKATSTRWHGMPAPNGGIYEADVFTESFYLQYSRQDQAAGLVVFTPSATLRNNRGTGNASEADPSNPIVPTVVGDPMGTSKVRYAADVPWHRKFTGNFQPHGNDQHPYLIWNLYRIDPQGRIEQIGRSGVKHAFLTINTGCDQNPGNGHILGRGCIDIYGTGNNDNINDLGPREEIIPSTGQWGRCGSVYDRDCNGARDVSSPCSNLPGVANCSSWAFRMQVPSARIDPAQNAGASYFAEAWYIVRDDVDILNTMQSRPVSFSIGSPPWTANNNSPLRLGPAIDRWVPLEGAPPNQASVRVRSAEGESRVAVKVTDLGSGQFRYDYAVMNLDFSRAVTEGAEPNLRVLRNNGFNRFEVPMPAAAAVSGIEFGDGDTDVGNDWTARRQGDLLIWEAGGTATAPINPLNWGVLFRYSFVTSVAPETGVALLGIAEPGGVPALEAQGVLAPAAPNERLFADGFELGAGR